MGQVGQVAPRVQENLARLVGPEDLAAPRQAHLLRPPAQEARVGLFQSWVGLEALRGLQGHLEDLCRLVVQVVQVAVVQSDPVVPLARAYLHTSHLFGQLRLAGPAHQGVQ